MKPIKLYSAASIDAYVAKPDGSVDWLFTDSGEDYGYYDFYDSIDTTLMGYNTYEKILSFGGDFPYPNTKNYVFSRKHHKEEDHPVDFIKEDMIAFVRKLKLGEGNAIWLIGGGQINTALLEAGLIDEMILSIHPIILGEGIPLFAHPAPMADFTLVEHKAFESGLLQVTYQKK